MAIFESATSVTAEDVTIEEGNATRLPPPLPQPPFMNRPWPPPRTKKVRDLLFLLYTSTEIISSENISIFLIHVFVCFQISSACYFFGVLQKVILKNILSLR